MPSATAETEQPIQPASTALLLMDFMVGILSRYEEADPVMARVRALKAFAVKAGLPTIYVRVAFRAGHPEVSPRNKLFHGWVASGRMVEGTPEAEIHQGVVPSFPQDTLVTKRRVSAFAGSDLEHLLRAQSVDTLILAGVATSGVVLSTVREAADRDYRLIVVSDCCTDSDQALHQMLIERLFPRQALVTDLAGLLEIGVSECGRPKTEPGAPDAG
jgi:nicotinamidase-related amidase